MIVCGNLAWEEYVCHPNMAWWLSLPPRTVGLPRNSLPPLWPFPKKHGRCDSSDATNLCSLSFASRLGQEISGRIAGRMRNDRISGDKWDNKMDVAYIFFLKQRESFELPALSVSFCWVLLPLLIQLWLQRGKLGKHFLAKAHLSQRLPLACKLVLGW